MGASNSTKHVLQPITLSTVFFRTTVLRALLVYVALIVLGYCTGAFAQSSLPYLTGRIVDNAHLLDKSTISNLTPLLERQEQKSGDQIVIATVPNLAGQDIESYSNALFRHWRLGQKDKNNGVLFLIAPNDRAVRIEVGYGLEGILTDATTSVIINTIILPKFRQNNYRQGIIEGARAIVTVVSGEESELSSQIQDNVKQINKEKSAESRKNFIAATIILLCFLIFYVLPMLAATFGTKVGPKRYRWLGIVFFLWFQDLFKGGGGPGGGGFGGGFGGGGFRGGGGSSGGGGASGRW